MKQKTKQINGIEVISKTEFKKLMRTVGIDLVEGETFNDWFDLYWSSLKESGHVITKGKFQYVRTDV